MSHPVELSQAAQAALVKLRHARDRTAYYREIEEQSRAIIESELGDAHDAATVDGVEVVTWTYVKSTRLDQKALKEQAPDLWAVFCAPTQTRRFVVKDV